MKKITICMPEKTYTQFLDLQTASGLPPQEVIRLGLGFVKLAIEVRQSKQKLLVASPDGSTAREVVLEAPMFRTATS
jgi:hypothetical protein